VQGRCWLAASTRGQGKESLFLPATTRGVGRGTRENVRVWRAVPVRHKNPTLWQFDCPKRNGTKTASSLFGIMVATTRCCNGNGHTFAAPVLLRWRSCKRLEHVCTVLFRGVFYPHGQYGFYPGGFCMVRCPSAPFPPSPSQSLGGMNRRSLGSPMDDLRE
jgi:hypothetical protein